MGKVLVTEHILGAAIRYALPRCSTFPSIVIEETLTNMDAISDAFKELLIKDIDNAFKNNEISSHKVDQGMWLDLKEALKEALESTVPLYQPKHSDNDYLYKCPKCNKPKEVEYGKIKKDDGSLEPTTILGFINCCNSCMVVTLGGKSIRKK